MKKATSLDVARLAGVSQTTVSLVLSGSMKISVSEETRERVAQAARELDYQLPARTKARARQAEKRMLLLLVPTLTNQYYTDLARMVEDYAEKNNFQVVICNTYRRTEMEKQYLETFADSLAGGIIYTFLPSFPTQAELLSRRVPTVIIGEKESSLRVCSIELNNEVAGTLIAEHLYLMGHRKMVFISTPFNHLTLARGQRLNGIRRQLAQYGLENSLEVIAAEGPGEADQKDDMPYEYSVGRKLTGELMDRGTDATALIGVNDMTAFGILDELRARGLRVPQDYSVCGFDNVFSARLSSLGLTTIDHQMRLRCQEAVNMILAQWNGSSAPLLHKIEYAPLLVARSSTGPARPGKA
ncbi:MAG: LacI family DNA-binding transcriptional regulator [Clostridia bacterium]|nr:LacI family DNA-binding transcriptional regulator [Clostridia bacterium]